MSGVGKTFLYPSYFVQNRKIVSSCDRRFMAGITKPVAEIHRNHVLNTNYSY